MGRTFPLHVALDTNFVLKLADDNNVCREALECLQNKRPPPVMIVPPTVGQELAKFALDDTNPRLQTLACKALQSIRQWGLAQMNLPSWQHGIADEISNEILVKQLIPPEERNDRLIVAEACLLDCDILISADKHLKNANRDILRAVLRPFGKETLVFSPQQINQHLRPAD